jgi:hypothetical protein
VVDFCLLFARGDKKGAERYPYNTLRPKNVNRQGSSRPPPPEIYVTAAILFIFHAFDPNIDPVPIHVSNASQVFNLILTGH